MMFNNTKALTTDSVLIIQPCISRALGKSTAIFLQQVHYWLHANDGVGRVIHGTKWIHNSLEQWQKNISILSVSTIKRSIQKLRSLNILMVDHFGYKKSDRTNWYSINYKQLLKFIQSLSDQQGRRKLKNDHTLPSDQEGKDEDFSNNNQLKMNQSLGHFEPMYNTKITNKENTNKSEKKIDNLNEEEKQTDEVKKNYLAHQLLNVWNEEVGSKLKMSQMTKERARYLVAAYKTKFQSCMDQWRFFCRKITSSDFLMGRIKSSFQITIDWALKFHTIQRILEGSLGVQFKGEPLNKIICSQEQVLGDIKQTQEDDWIKDFRQRIVQILGHATYYSWFRQIKFSKNDGVIMMDTPSKFIADYVQSNLLPSIQGVCGKNLSLEICCP
jgi:hypothetical protein